MLINGGVVVCKFFSKCKTMFKMGGVIQGGMLPQCEDDHGLITLNRS